MKPMPIRYVRDMQAAERFYTVLGLTVEFSTRAPREGEAAWVEMGGDGQLALHQAAEQDPRAIGHGDRRRDVRAFVHRP